MNPQAAKELLDLIMMDDFVARRDALNKWGRRWLAMAEIYGRWESGLNPQQNKEARKSVVDVMRGEIFDALVADDAKVLSWEFGVTQHGEPSAKVTMHCIKAVPLEVE